MREPYQVYKKATDSFELLHCNTFLFVEHTFVNDVIYSVLFGNILVEAGVIFYRNHISLRNKSIFKIGQDSLIAIVKAL